MRTALICHQGATLDEELLSRWLTSFSDLVGVVILNETRSRVWKRIKTEFRRVGPLRFADVMAFRIYYRCFQKARDERWLRNEIFRRSQQYPPLSENVKLLRTHSPNSVECQEFLDKLKPDMVIARCKTILKKRIFAIPKSGTFVIHPGVCPEYRNAHGCFWALANADIDNVGATLLKVDCGVDTGPVYAYYKYSEPRPQDSHIVIQNRVVTENLDRIRDKLIEIDNRRAAPIPVDGRSSAVWGQPWMSAHRRFRQSLRSIAS